MSKCYYLILILILANLHSKQTKMQFCTDFWLAISENLIHLMINVPLKTNFMALDQSLVH